ncbi:MAG: 16S rRNA (cytosine(1402)-N(4))-methyltransferase RsmH [Alphaproteobacteria bacterium]
MNAVPHIPVMLHEVMAAAAPKAGELVVDGTFGAGGYSRALLKVAECRVVAIDRDPNVKLLADALAREFPGHFLFLPGRFGAMIALLKSADIDAVDAIILDIGLSSMQIDDAARGFSFRGDAPLDMRMGGEGVSASDVVNRYSEAQLAKVLFDYGEEKNSRRLAKAIVAARAEAPITTTRQLAEIIERASGAAGRAQKIHPATRSFQAIRIEVNQELVELQQALAASLKLLKPGGRLVVVTFHSLEDRIVKRFMAEHSGKTQGTSRHLPASFAAPETAAFFARSARYFPGADEIQANPRARSATLRVATRLPEAA